MIRSRAEKPHCRRSLKQAIDIAGAGRERPFRARPTYTAGEIINLGSREALKYLALADDLFARLGSRALGVAHARKQHNQWIAKIAPAATTRSSRRPATCRARAYLQRRDRAGEAVELAIAADPPQARYRLPCGTVTPRIAGGAAARRAMAMRAAWRYCDRAV